jgi:hypothetical protein
MVVHMREDTCHAIVHSRDPGTRHRDIGTREIGVPEVMKVGTSEVSKTRGVIRTVHQRRTRGSNRSHRGKSRQEVIYRHFGHRDIGNPGDKRFGHFRITKSETPTRRKVPLWGPAVSISEKSGFEGSGFEGSTIPWANVFQHLKIMKPR